MTRRVLRLTRDTQESEPYQRVPFEVPAGAAAVEVRLSYDGAEAVIDLGCEGAAGWRGWSGGARRRFAITPEAATPGYVPGELEEGLWSVVLGQYRIPAEGIEVQVDIAFSQHPLIESDPDAPVASGNPRGSSRDLPADDGLRWYAGDFHAHTVHSDGSLGIGQLAAHAARCGLDFLAVTDHNTVSHHAHLAAAGIRHGLTLLPGQEVTAGCGHANAFGDIGWIDFRRPAEEWLAVSRARGGLLSINHPLHHDTGWRASLRDAPDAIELWHVEWYLDLASTAPWDFLAALARPGGLADRRDVPERSSDPRASAGGPALLGGSDFHSPQQGWNPGTPTTWVAATGPEPEAIFAAVRAGRTAVSFGVQLDRQVDPFGTPLLLGLAEELVAVDADGLTLVDGEGRRQTVIGDRHRITSGSVSGPCRLVDEAGRIMALCGDVPTPG